MLIAALLIVAPVSMGRQAKPVKPAPPYAQFWTDFKAAVSKGDSKQVASMTKLPFMLENKNLSEAGFIRKFDYIFDKKVKACFAKAKTVKEGEGFWVFCGQQIFIFEKVEGSYKFTEIGVND